VIVIAASFTPVHRYDDRLAVPWSGRYPVVVDTDASVSAGSGVPVPDVVDGRLGQLHGGEQSLELPPLPGLSVVVLKPER
jgi:1,4-alpha-glucan branching enzyme